MNESAGKGDERDEAMAETSELCAVRDIAAAHSRGSGVAVLPFVQVPAYAHCRCAHSGGTAAQKQLQVREGQYESVRDEEPEGICLAVQARFRREKAGVVCDTYLPGAFAGSRATAHGEKSSLLFILFVV